MFVNTFFSFFYINFILARLTNHIIPLDRWLRTTRCPCGQRRGSPSQSSEVRGLPCLPTLLGTEQALHLRYIMRLTFIMESYAELILKYNIPPEQFLYDTLLPCIIEYYLELFTFRNRPVCTAEELAYGRGALQEV